MVEVIAGIGGVGVLASYVLIEVRFPESLVTVLDPEALPEGWRAYPAPASTQRIGDAWVRRAASPVLRVPSILVPGESNFLLNPRHPEFGRLKIARPEPVAMDSRLGW
jgi:RES domain-containing protein